jgi:hypothetical protein
LNTIELINKLQIIEENLSDLKYITISFKDEAFSKILKDTNVKEILLFINPFKASIELYGNNKFIKQIGTISNFLANKIIFRKITVNELANSLAISIKSVLNKENIVVPDFILFHLQVADNSDFIILNNYKKKLNSNNILREIRLKSSDGTDLQKTKLGGLPIWVQNNETPVCPNCKNPMSFIGQIDSFDDDWHKLRDNPRYYFSDDGIIYIFFPFCCGEDPKVVFQGY